MSIAVETPLATVLHDFETRLVMTIEQLVGNAAIRPFAIDRFAAAAREDA